MGIADRGFNTPGAKQETRIEPVEALPRQRQRDSYIVASQVDAEK